MKTIIVMPAFNAGRTLNVTVSDIPLECVDEIILVDDSSMDNTIEVANSISKSFPYSIAGYQKNSDRNTLFTIMKNDHNKGYGGNQKVCYDTALSHGADIIAMIHPDYQYDPKLIKYFIEFIREGYFDVMLGSRIRSRREALQGGMPLYKYIANRMLSLIENIATGRNLSEWHTGMRAYKKDVLNNVDYSNFSDDFVFDTQMLLGIVEKGYTIADIPVPVRYFKDSSSINFVRSVKYGIATLMEVLKFLIRGLYRKFKF